MIVKKVFYRELVNNASKIFIVLIFILPITELFKLLDQAATGSIPVVTLVTLMTYGVITSFPMILTIACFLAITITINRYCKDKEFDVWLASGVSPFYWLKLVSVFSLSTTLICAICTMYISPWAKNKSDIYKEYLLSQQTSLVISPGVFKEINRNQVLYSEYYSLTSGFARNIFVQYTNGSTFNITAKGGKIQFDDGFTNLILEDGHRYELDSHDNVLILNFKKFVAKLNQQYRKIEKNFLDISTSSTYKLLKIDTKDSRAELSWRISVPLMMFVMCFLVVPISIQAGRVESNLIFILPPIINAVYQSIVLNLNSYLGMGKITSVWYVQIIHLFILIIALILTYIKTYPKGYLFSKNKK